MADINDRDRTLRDEGMEDSTRGKGNDIKGRVKDAVGGLTGDQSMQAEGKMDRAKGKAQDKLGDAKRELDDHNRR